jgi:hypothetical protein
MVGLISNLQGYNMVVGICLVVSLLVNVGLVFALVDHKLVSGAAQALKNDVEAVEKEVKKL